MHISIFNEMRQLLNRLFNNMVEIPRNDPEVTGVYFRRYAWKSSIVKQEYIER